MNRSLPLLFSFLLAAATVHAADLDTYGGFTDVKGEKTGFFHTQKIGGSRGVCRLGAVVKARRLMLKQTEYVNDDSGQSCASVLTV